MLSSSTITLQSAKSPTCARAIVYRDPVHVRAIPFKYEFTGRSTVAPMGDPQSPLGDLGSPIGGFVAAGHPEALRGRAVAHAFAGPAHQARRPYLNGIAPARAPGDIRHNRPARRAQRPCHLAALLPKAADHREAHHRVPAPVHAVAAPRAPTSRPSTQVHPGPPQKGTSHHGPSARHRSRQGSRHRTRPVSGVTALSCSSGRDKPCRWSAPAWPSWPCHSPPC
jgi:hypothetical protein